MPSRDRAPIESRLERALLSALFALRSPLSLAENQRLAARAAALAAQALVPAEAGPRASRMLLQAPNVLDAAEGRRWDQEISRILRRPNRAPQTRHALVFEDVFTELYAPATDFAFLLVYEPCLRFLA